MIKKTLFAIFALFASLFAGAQTYTFECVASGRLTGDSCDICPSTTVESRSFNGLVIFRDGEFYRWVDQPYSIREKPGGMIEYWEHAVTPYNERVSIPFALTGFFSIQGMKDSTWCNSPGPVRFQELQLDSVSPTLAKIRLSGSNTGVGVRAGTALSFDFQSDTLKIDASGVGTVTDFSAGDLSPLFTTSEATTTTTPALSFAPIAQSANTFYRGPTTGSPANPTFGLITTADITGLLVANNGVSDNEAGGVYRLGNRYMNSPDAPFTTDRKVNIAGFLFHIGDNNDSTLLVVDGTNNRVGVGTLPTVNFEVGSSSATYGRWNTTSITANAGIILNNEGDANASWAVYRQGDGDFAIGSSTTEWPSGTLTDPIIIKPNPPNNSFYMDASGNVQLNGTSPQRRLHVTGEARITDLVTDNPTVLVGADADGDLSAVTLGTGLSYTGTTLNATGGTNYQTMRDNGTNETQRAALNFISSGRISATLTDDLGNNETEATFDVVANSIANTHIRQGVARSVIGVTGNATANVADIQGTADQVLRVTTAGTALAFGTVATGGIADDAVTYAKLQNVAANLVLLGNDNGVNQNAQELTVTDVYALLGLSGVDTRIAVWKGTQILGNDAGLVFDYTNDRQTITCDLPGSGAGAAALNIANVGTDASGEFLQMRGNMSANMSAGMYNVNNTGSLGNAIWVMSVGGATGGDPFFQFNVNTVVTHSFGVDNSDGDKVKLTMNGATPGANGNDGFTWSNTSPPRYGINIATPLHPLDVTGVARATQWRNTGNDYTAANLVFDTGAGTGPTLHTIAGGNNWVEIDFTTGTAPTANGNIFTVTYPNAFTANSIVVPGANDPDAANAIGDKLVYLSTTNTTTFTLTANGTLPASTRMFLSFSIGGY